MPFPAFAKLFPEAEFPVRLGEDTYRHFEATGKLVPDEMMAEFIAPMEPVELDEFTEVLTCVRFSRKGYTALVYWKAGLLHNHYRLATFDQKGNPVENRVIAGSYTDADGTTQSAATITEDLTIYVVSAQQHSDVDLGAADKSSALRLSIDGSGLIRDLVDPKDN